VLRRDCHSFSSLYLARAFFANALPAGQLLNTAAIFAGGFLVRPVGAYVMGSTPTGGDGGGRWSPRCC